MNLEALRDVLQGPGFWERNVALGGRLATLRAKIISEKLQAPTESDLRQPLAHQLKPEKNWKKRVRALTLNGHLVPRFVARRLVAPRIAVAHITAPQPVFAFLREAVIYRIPDSRVFIATRDTHRFFALFCEMVALSAKLCANYGRLRTDYSKSVDFICTKNWWDRAVAREEEHDPSTLQSGS